MWQCVAFTYDETDGTRIFVGSGVSPMSEVLYASRAAGSGATEGDSANPLYFGNRDTHASAWIGQVEEQAHFGRRLSIDELRAWAREPAPWDARVYIHHGMSGPGIGTQIDLTGNGNHGTISGPVLPSFERSERVSFAQTDCDDWPAWRFQVVAGGGGGFNAAWARNANTVIQSGVRAA
jgi:hypothetical protein